MTSLIENPLERGILIIDDDSTTTSSLKEFLELDGYKNVVTASSGEEGLSLLEQKGDLIYAIILDLMMPGMNGIEFINHLINVHKYVVGIIMLTGYGSKESEDQFYALGGGPIITSSYLNKPYNLRRLLNRTNEVSSSIHQKRMGFINICTYDLHKRLDIIENKINELGDVKDILEIARKIERRQPNFLMQLGMDLIRAILIAAAVLSLLFLDFGNLFKEIISK